MTMIGSDSDPVSKEVLEHSLREADQEPSKNLTQQELLYREVQALGGYYGFLLNNKIGQWLVDNCVVQHPLESRKAAREKKLRDITQLFLDTSAEPLTREEAERLAHAEPDFKYQDKQYAWTQKQIIHKFFWQEKNLKTCEANNLGIALKVSSKDLMPFTGEQVEEEQSFDDKFKEVYEDTIHIHLRDMVLKLVQRKKWAKLLEILYANRDNRKIIEVIRGLLSDRGRAFSQERKFVQATINLLAQKMVLDGVSTFLDFCEFLTNNFQLQTPEELPNYTLVDQDSLESALDGLWMRDKELYFNAIKELNIWDLLPPEYFHGLKYEFRLLEILLLTRCNKKFEIYWQGSLSATLKDYPNLQAVITDLDPKNLQPIYRRYTDLCLHFGKSENKEIFYFWHGEKY